MARLVFFLGGLLLVQLVHSHHSTLGLYNEDRIVEIEGVVTSVRWGNPHPAYTVAVLDENGETVEWDVQGGGSVTTLRLRGVDRDVVKVGDRLRIAGESSTRGLPEMFASNFLLENGQEVVLGIDSEPRWVAGLGGDLFQSRLDEALVEDARQAADGIFRVWTVVLDDPASFRLYRDNVSPLTESASELKAQWDPRASPYLGCEPRGMPYLMTTPFPFEFVRRENDMVLRAESYDSERFIHMGTVQPPSSEPYSLLGYSTGRWEGNRLVVETDRIDAPYFYGDGTPQSRSIQLVEHFTLNEQEDRLDYLLVITDPETFTETLEFSRYWTWRPEVCVEPFNCAE